MDNFTLNTHHAYLNNDIIFKCNGSISIVDIVTGIEYQFTNELKTRLCAGNHIFVNTTTEETNNNSIKQNFDLQLVGEFSIDTYKRMFNTDELTIFENPNKLGNLFFCCGFLPNGKKNIGAVGEKAKELIAAKAPKDQLRVDVYKTYNDKGQMLLLSILQANTNGNVIDSQREEVSIEDAIKLGGGCIKGAFVFDDNPWVFVTTKDRLYITNKETKEEKLEYSITPDSIKDLGKQYASEHFQYFLFQTKNDYAVYDVLYGKIIFSFDNHIYSNYHLVIYKKENGIEVYDFRQKKVVEYFEGQYSFGNKFYFVKEGKLYGLNTSSSFINAIDFVGEIGEEDLLMDNYLLKLEKDNSEKKEYSYFWLGNGENFMNKTKLVFPYYIENWKGENTKSFQRTRVLYNKFKEENKGLLSVNSYIKSMCIGVRINRSLYEWENHSRMITLYGEIVAYPALKHAIPFKLKGIEGEMLDYKDATIEQMPMIQNDTETIVAETVYELNTGEKELGKSSSGNLIITKEESKLFLRNISENSREEILSNSFDSSSYSNAYFSSDGKSVVLQINNNEGKILGFEDLNMTHFDVEGFTVARNEGFNGYKPEIAILDGRKPVWRDPISLARILEKDMSKHVFMSPDGKYSADTSMKTVYYNRLEKKEISLDVLYSEKDRYDWRKEASDQEKKDKRELRKELMKRYGRELLFEHVLSHGWGAQEIENLINYYLESSDSFTPVFIDELGFVCYHTNHTDEYRILIGRSVWFLNYVSFSYDSKYLAFGAKMKRDEFRFSEEGVFVLFDLVGGKEIIRQKQDVWQDSEFKNSLCAVWMTMFNIIGDVAYYDSSPNAYIVTAESNYKETKKAQGKSLLCFSPTGKYIALSDQSYVDYAHHPEIKWGHQPSGNVYIHSTDSFEQCLEQYNDLGDGIKGVASQAGSVSSAAFSQDERRLLVVGNDGVVVVRNLKYVGKVE